MAMGGRLCRNFFAQGSSNPMSSFSRSRDPSAVPSPVATGAADGSGELLKQAQHGDRAAYGRLVVLYQDRIFNAVLRMVGDRDEAAELTQEAFTRGLESLDSFRCDSAVYTWLFRIAMNLAISRLRQVQRHRVFSLDSGNGRAHDGDGQARGLVDRARRESSDQPSSAMETRERAEQVVAALGRL